LEKMRAGVRRLAGASLIVAAFGLLAPALPARAQVSGAAESAKAEGDRLARAGDLDAAVAAYERALADSPDFALARNELGTALFRLGRLDEAITEFEHAVRLDADYATAWFNLAFASRRAERWETAIDAYRRHTELRADEPDAYHGLAESLAAAGRKAEAADAYEAYAQRENRPARQERARQARSRASALREEVAQAEAAAQPAEVPAATAPARPGATAARRPAEPAAISESPEAARAPAAAPAADKAAHLREGDARLSAGEADAAIAAYARAKAADPRDPEVLYKLAFAHARTGAYAEAIGLWERVLEIEPSNAGARRNVALARSRLEGSGAPPAPEGAAPAPRGEPDRAGARDAYQRGVRLIHEQRFEPAVEALSEALERDPGLAQAHIARGSAYVGLRRFEEARADYEAALRLRPQMAAPLYGLAETHRALGDTAEARRYYQRYVESEARDVDAALKEQARSWAERL
jgi:tetratricopeptide (TPR) repeat protein